MTLTITNSGNTTPIPNRAERRRQENHGKKRAKQYDKRQMFTKEEMEAQVTTAYALGIQLAMNAAKEVLGLGEKRLSQVAKRLQEIEAQRLGPDAAGTWQMTLDGKGVNVK